MKEIVMTDRISYLNSEQVATLLKPIRASRVLSLSKGRGPALSYVAQHDVRAHLNRIFGFGRWSMDVKSTEFVFEEKDANGRWNACYRATVRLTIHAPDGTEIAHYEDSHASGNAPQPDRAEAHALALTIAVSTAMKRAASCLGDQFGLSLYNKGQKSEFVKTTLIGADTGFDDDVTIVSMGDESDQSDEGGPASPSTVEEQPAPAETVNTETGEIVADEVDGAVGELRAFSSLGAAGDRILSVAKWKQTYSHLLGETIPVKGQSVTLGVLADQVAAGAFSKES